MGIFAPAFRLRYTQIEKMEIAELIAKTTKYLPAEKLSIIEQAYDFALKCHQGQVRLSGEPYVEHPLQTALFLADLQLDTATIAAALLHDVIEDCGVSLETIEAKFGPEVRKLVDGTTKLARLTRQASEKKPISTKDTAAAHAESLRRMFVAMAEDLRVVFIKLADRLHNMRTLEALPKEKQHTIAAETLEIFAPLAHRLGIWELKWQLEDLAFSYLEPQKYHEVAQLLAQRRAEREDFVLQAVSTLNAELKKVGLKAEVVGRPKHIYSIAEKMKRYAAQGKRFGDIHDLVALRVLVDTVKDCYGVLGVVHSLWHPLPGEFNDFIANPKDNGYQSLHTTVMYQGVTSLEIQIRTQEMHRIAEYGVAAHWRYKEGDKKDMHFEQKIAWLRQLLEWHKELSGAEEFLESIKTDIFIDQVFVFTPKGEIKELPKGATPLDFAYRIHTDLGNRCIGAKVNGKLVSLNYELHSGDTVEILATRVDKGPSRDWLNPDLGLIKTSHARSKIRQWFGKEERSENVERGRRLLEKELKRLTLSSTSQEEIAHLFNYENVEDFLAALGCGEVTPNQIAVKLAAQQEELPRVAAAVPSKVTSAGVQVLGTGDLLTRLAECCHPVPGDEIVGFITRSRGVTVHRKNCPNILQLEEQERLIDVTWGQVVLSYPVAIQVKARDRVGLLRDISTMVAEEKLNIVSATASDSADHTASVFLTVNTRDLEQLSRLLSRIEAISGVISVTRTGAGKKSS